MFSFFSPFVSDFLLHPFRKPKRVRTAFSPGQLLKLEHAFESNQYVVGAERKALAQALNLSETQVNMAFRFIYCLFPIRNAHAFEFPTKKERAACAAKVEKKKHTPAILFIAHIRSVELKNNNSSSNWKLVKIYAPHRFRCYCIWSHHHHPSHTNNNNNNIFTIQ